MKSNSHLLFQRLIKKQMTLAEELKYGNLLLTFYYPFITVQANLSSCRKRINRLCSDSTKGQWPKLTMSYSTSCSTSAHFTSCTPSSLSITMSPSSTYSSSSSRDISKRTENT